MEDHTKHERVAVSFRAIEARVRDVSTTAGTSADLRKLALPLIVTLCGFALVLGARFVGAETYKLLMALGGVATQLIGLSLLAYRQSRDILSELQYKREDFANDLDQEFWKYNATVQWLRELPKDQLVLALRYIDQRVASLSRRHGAMFGPIEKLGLLPAVVACVLQLSGISNPSSLFWGAGVVIVLFYFVGLWLLGLKFQLQLYSQLLAASLGQESSGIAS